jgi:hypothetical protein
MQQDHLKKNVIIVLMAAILVGVILVTLMAKPSGGVDLAGTTWDVILPFGPGPSVTYFVGTFKFESDGTFSQIFNDGRVSSSPAGTWRWEGERLIMILRTRFKGGDMVGKVISASKIKGTVTNHFGLLQDTEKTGEEILFTMTLQRYQDWTNR